MADNGRRDQTIPGAGGASPATAADKPGAGSEAPRLHAFSQGLPIALMRAREAVMDRLRPMLRRHGVTEQQWRVLRTLAGEATEVEVTQLAQLVFLQAPSLSRILRDLGRRGLIARRAAKADLRRALVSITEKGLQLIAEVAPEAAYQNAEIERLFGEQRMAQLRALLGELEAILGGRGRVRG
jgi:homoprotocatechuate degradation regulator HpaR